MQIVIDQSIVDGYQQALDLSLKRQQELIQQVEAISQQAQSNRMLSIEQARQYLGNISVDTLLYYRSRGLEYYKKGRDGVWYRQGDIDNWLASGKVRQHS